jgi:hypothetical protein
MNTYVVAENGFHVEYNDNGITVFETQEDAERYTLTNGGVMYKGEVNPHDGLPDYEAPMLARGIVWLDKDPASTHIDEEINFAETVDEAQNEELMDKINQGAIGIAAAPIIEISGIELTTVAYRRPNEDIFAFRKRVYDDMTKKYTRMRYERPELDTRVRKTALLIDDEG